MTQESKTDPEMEHGKRIFASMTAEDKQALKRFLTGQIQNILSNEHGIGGRADTVSTIQHNIERKIEKKLLDDEYLGQIIKKVLDGRAVSLMGIIDRAVAKEAQNALQDRFNEAARMITFNVSVEEKEIKRPDNFGKF
jgi:hypothetical protein